ncbi:adenylyl-sulfate kinase [Stenomitos frigidus]|uniref:Adenylyl-sulfate kinase n=1 Tax=Stenomitos frigidus ULC18 TaxID=2107698 RepID=A0A2T1DTK1_9CYAN|nr:adenylyl-sulfate kinase [Stenomitos frigidus]PSB23802.1 adenylyl-sulfate kinase [Stenomitos frigidus ULC18]
MKTNGMVIWLTGLSGAGKTTIAKTLECLLLERQLNVEVLDGDIIRTNLSKGLGYTKEDRDTNIRRVGFVANLLSRNGVIVIVATISPHRLVRDEMRAMMHNFLEVYVNAPFAICESRDVKGLYAAARMGEVKEFTGLDAPYEAPLKPDITCFTDQETVEESVAKIMQALSCASVWDDSQLEPAILEYHHDRRSLPARQRKASPTKDAAYQHASLH